MRTLNVELVRFYGSGHRADVVAMADITNDEM